jgi:hypothetical protein
MRLIAGRVTTIRGPQCSNHGLDFEVGQLWDELKLCCSHFEFLHNLQLKKKRSIHFEAG